MTCAAAGQSHSAATCCPSISNRQLAWQQATFPLHAILHPPHIATAPARYAPHLQGWIFDEGALSMQDFLTHFWLRRGEPASLLDNASHWHTMASWYPHR